MSTCAKKFKSVKFFKWDTDCNKIFFKKVLLVICIANRSDIYIYIYIYTYIYIYVYISEDITS